MRFEYEAAPEDTTHVNLQDSYGLFINGEFTSAQDGKTFQTLNPATEEVLADVAYAAESDVDRAVKAAQSAYDTVWSKLTGKERGKYIYRIARRLQEKARELAVLESLDGGKPIKEARDVDIPLAANHFFYYAGWADKLSYATFGGPPKSLGVVGQVIPWNFPLLMAAWKIAPALAAGNTVVLKPAETTPLTALHLCKLFQEIDLPKGVVNIICGDGATGANLIKHPGIKKVAFTGSTKVGKQIAQIAHAHQKAVTLELGGKGAHIIFEDAAINQAVEGVVRGIYFNQGHVCCAGSRLFVQERVMDAVIERLSRRIETLRVGNPLDKNTDIGAINSKMQLDKINDYISIGIDEGAKVRRSSCKLPTRGYFCAPTFFTDVSPAHRIAREEIFGPVLSVLSFRTTEEVIQKANNSPYGLSAGIWSEKGSKVLAVSQRLEAGIIWDNTFNQFDPAAPFGGYKESGFGREGGMQGLYPYLSV